MRLQFGNSEHIAKNKEKPKPVNPMIAFHGKAEGFFSCRECEWITRENYGKKTYYKCDKRGYSRGAGTDHRMNWDACGLFEYRIEKEMITLDGERY